MQSFRPVNLLPNDPNSFVFLNNQNPPAQPNSHHGHSQPLPFQHNYCPANKFQTENRSNHNKSITFTSRNPKQECIRINHNTKPLQGYQFYSTKEVTIGDNYGPGRQSSKITQEPKFSYHPSGEQGDRTSIGLCLEEVYNPQKPYRRSQSLYKVRHPEMEKQSSGKEYINSYRDVSQYNKVNEVLSNTSNNFQAKISSPICTDVTQIEQQPPKKKGESPFLSLFSKYDQYHQSKPNPSDNYKQFNYKSYLDEVNPPASKYSEPFPVRKQSTEYQKYAGYPSSTLVNKNAGQIEDKVKRDSSKDQFPLQKDYNKTLTTIGKDIEALKNATKQSKEVFQKEIQKNAYLSKLLEKRASKASEEDVSDWYKSQVSGLSKQEKSTNKDQQMLELKQRMEEATKKLQVTNRQLQIQIIQLQKQLQVRGQEVTQKNNEIWDKSKIIIEKNKTIDNISNQLRQSKQIIEKANDWQAVSKRLQEKIIKQQAEIDLRDRKISEMQVSTQEILAFLQKEKEQRQKIQQQNSLSVSSLNQTISRLNQSIESIQKENHKYTSKIQQLRAIISESDIEVYQLKSSLIAHQKQVMLLKEQIQSQQPKEIQAKQMISIAVEAIQSQIEESTLDQLQNEVEQFNQDSSQDLLKEQTRHLEEIIASYEAREKEIAHLLLEGNEHDHEKVINRLKELMQHCKTVEAAKEKEQQRIQEHQLYRMHHDYLEKKCQEMNRQLKRAGNKLIGVSNEAHQSWRLLNQYNTEIIILNLINLNEKYRQSDQDQIVQEDEQQQQAEEYQQNLEGQGGEVEGQRGEVEGQRSEMAVYKKEAIQEMEG